MPQKKWLLYDGRACGDQGTDAAMVLEACSSEEEALEAKGDHGDMACYSYTENENGVFDNETWEWDYFE